MYRFSGLLAALCAGCFCTTMVRELPIPANGLLPHTQKIAETAVLPTVQTPPLLQEQPPQRTDENKSETVSRSPLQAVPIATPTATACTTCVPVATATTACTTATLVTEVATTSSTETVPAETAAPAEIFTEEEIQVTDSVGETFLASQQTWFKAYMDYRTITDTDSVQYAIQQAAWTDTYGLRRSGEDYLVAMGTGWLEEGCGERFQVTLESGSSFTVMVGDIKANCHTDASHRYRTCAGGANVLEFIVDTDSLSAEAKNAGTVSVYPELEGNIAEIARIS